MWRRGAEYTGASLSHDTLSLDMPDAASLVFLSFKADHLRSRHFLPYISRILFFVIILQLWHNITVENIVFNLFLLSRLLDTHLTIIMLSVNRKLYTALILILVLRVSNTVTSRGLNSVHCQRVFLAT